MQEKKDNKKGMKISIDEEKRQNRILLRTAYKIPKKTMRKSVNKRKIKEQRRTPQIIMKKTRQTSEIKQNKERRKKIPQNNDEIHEKKYLYQN